jgi:hypothetical protein
LEPEIEPSSRAQSFRWLFGLLGILSTVALFAPRYNIRQPSERSKDNPQDKNSQIPRGVPHLEANAMPSEPCKYKPENNRKVPTWEKISSGAQALIALVTAGLLIVNLGQMRATKIAAKAAQHSAEAAKTQAEIAELAERPFIKIVDVKTRGNNPIVPALSFQYPGPPNAKGTQATFQLQIFLKNIGHSVTTVDVDFDLFLAHSDSNRFSDEIIGEESKFCDSFLSQNRHVPTLRAVIFPDDPYEWNGAAASIVGAQNINYFPDTGKTGFIVPVVVICTNYHLWGSEKTYQTRALYEVFRSDNRTRFFEVGRGMPAEHIFMQKDPFGDYAY